MALDDSSLYARTKNKLCLNQYDYYKVVRRCSLPQELLSGFDVKGKITRNIKILEPLYLRKPRKRPSIIPDHLVINNQIG
ncbi:furry homolog isoform X1 [Pelobates cultripes]|uniref:Furry homolog isoform X1 n=1 Tax=Pelobates cultripes TaxID=61616 RepID=A0AAD1R7G4_PELCU|nr:furry homolog isoform X1 [Pelobates cultripes]